MDDRSSYTVLVVDDNPATLYATARVLRAAGFATLEAETGAKGLELAEYASLIILDVNLPDIHGLEVARLLRAHPRTGFLPILHLSAAHVSPMDAAAGLHAGGDEYLVAPVTPEELVDAAERLIDQAAARLPAPQQREWLGAHRQLIAAEQELFDVAARVARSECDASALDAAEQKVRELRQQAETILDTAVRRLRDRRP